MQEILSVLQGLSDENRLRIINLLLAADELCVCDIERVLEIPQTRVSRHLNILRSAGMVSARRQDQWMHYRLASDLPFQQGLFDHLRSALDGIAELREDLDRLRGSTALACGPLKECCT